MNILQKIITKIKSIFTKSNDKPLLLGSSVSNTNSNLQPSKKLLDLLSKIEGERLEPYLCAAGVPTIGRGCTYYENGTPVKMTDKKITKARSQELFEFTVKSFGEHIKKVIKQPMSQQQFDAFILICYNCGKTAFAKPAQVALHFNNKDLKLVAEWWPKSFVTAKNPKTGKSETLIGLVNRRKAEFDVFSKGIYKMW